MAIIGEKELVDSLAGVKRTSKYSDLVIRCHEREWKVHRVVICPRSKFFEIACDGDFKESKTGQINLVDDDPDVVDHMIDYLYRMDYDDKPNAAKAYPSDGPLVTNANVYAIADKYEIWSLKNAAKWKTEEALKTDWNHDSFLSSLDIVRTATPQSDRGLRDLFIPVIAAHKDYFRKNEAFMDYLRANGDLAVDVIEHGWDSMKRITELYCDSEGCKGNYNIRCAHCSQSQDLYLHSM
ncbi:hypothetical protein MMC26_002153 [Xylographa opegraphella]|nr:hypothetical protein [Xylographa opegraphella]